jgi:hypothetical protein
MIAIIYGALLKFFGYWQKPVTGRLGRFCQNNSFIAVISSRERSAMASEIHRNWHRDEND